MELSLKVEQELIKKGLLDKIVAFEAGQLAPPEVVTLFQILVDSGLVWELQGGYGRMAWSLMEQGYVKIPERMIN